MIMEQRSTRSRFWPGMIFGLIGLNFCVVGLTVYAAHARSRSFSVEPEFDRKALHWEETARQAVRNQELGWAIRLEGAGHGRLSVALVDRQGVVIDGADIEAEVFHHARAARRSKVRFAPSSGGMYEAPFRMDAPGLWELRFTARHGSDLFTTQQTRMIMEDVR